MNSSTEKKFFFKPLFYILLALAACSCLAIASAQPLISTTAGNPYTLYLKQVMWYAIGFAAMFLVYWVQSSSIYKIMWYIYGFLIFTLVLLALKHRFGIPIPFAKTINGATSWFVFPGIGSLQPSEFMKMVLIICLSDIVNRHNELNPIHSITTDIMMVIKVLAVSIPPCLLIYLQNDTGVVLIMLTSILFILFGSGIQTRWFILGVSVILLAGGALIFLFIKYPTIFSKILNSNKMDRFYGWLDPEGTYTKQGYQLFNALMSYGTASWFGYGFRSYVMYFPEAQTDFIFAVICQGAGLFGAFIVLLLILGLDICILYIGMRSENKHKYLCCGLFGLLFFQQLWNVSMVTGLLPITGITLPFLSYGGSSLLSYMLIMGILLDIEKETRMKKAKQI